MEIFFTQVNSVMAVLSQLLYDPQGNSHICKKFHPCSLYWRYFFLCQPCGIFECLSNILWFKVRIISQNLFYCGTMGNLANDNRDRNAHSTDAGTPTHDLRIKRYSVKVIHDIILSADKNYLHDFIINQFLRDVLY
jgi:hypothetical protein